MATRGLEGWHAAHSERFGAERWQDLHHAMHREVDPLLFLNPFLPPIVAETLEEEYSLVPSSVPGAYSFEMPENPTFQCRLEEFPHENAFFVEVQGPAGDGVSPFALLEGAQLLVAHALQVEEGDEVLDACAAPGGKALVLAGALFARAAAEGRRLTGRLVANESSKRRAAELQRVVRRYAHPVVFEAHGGGAAHIIFTSADLSTPSNSMERNGPYDRILLDVPSTNDHVLLKGHGANTLEQWSMGKLKVHADKQVKLLHNALWLLKEGGIVLYSVTALSKEETDDVIEAVVRKASGKFVLEILPLDQHILCMVPALAAEQTHWGTHLLPDTSGFGPRYFSRIRLVKRTHAAVEHLRW